MRRNFTALALACTCLIVLAGMGLRAQPFTLSTGETITGEPLHFDPNGVVFRFPDGRTSARVPWTNFPEVVLKQFANNPQAKPFVSQYLDMPEEEDSKKKPLTIKQPERLARPSTKSTLPALFGSPLSIALLALVYLANLYAALEIASFRNRPPGLVVGVAAVLPLIAPMLFLCLPAAREAGEAEPQYAEPAPRPEPQKPAAAPPPAYVPPPRPPAAEHRPIPVPSAAAEPEPERPAAAAAPRHPAPVTYQRGQTMFNRRFFETKLAGFLRMIPSESEKDLIIIVKSARGEFVGNRISKLQADELVLQYHKGTASSEVTLPFTEIQEVQVRHKDS